MKQKPVLTRDNAHRFHCFILFEPSSLRLSDHDVFLLGPKVTETYNQTMEKIVYEDDIKAQILKNRISKIGQMIQLLKSDSQVVVSKFFDNVWRRYNFVSNLGEYFIDYPTFVKLFPEYKDNKDIIAHRLDDFDDEEEKTETKKEPVEVAS